MEEFPHNIAVIGDRATATGFRLAGIREVYAYEDKTAEKKLAELLERENLGLIIVNETLLQKFDWRMKKRIERIAKPVIIIVPDHSGTVVEEAESLRSLVRRALGVDLIK